MTAVFHTKEGKTGFFYRFANKMIICPNGESVEMLLVESLVRDGN